MFVLTRSAKCMADVFSSGSAAEIDELYETGVPAWRWHKTVTEVEEQLTAALQVRSNEKNVATALSV